MNIKIALGVSQQFFVRLRVLKHDMSMLILSNFLEVGIKQNNVSTVIWLIKFLAINARNLHLWEKVRCLHFCLHNEGCNLSNI